MKKILILSLTIFITNLCFSQEEYNWDDVQNTVLYSITESEYCENITSNDLTSQHLIQTEKNEFKTILQTLKKPQYDILLEKECLILRIKFTDTSNDFIVYRNQGILIDLNNPINMFQIQDKNKFDSLLAKHL